MSETLTSNHRGTALRIKATVDDVFERTRTVSCCYNLLSPTSLRCLNIISINYQSYNIEGRQKCRSTHVSMRNIEKANQAVTDSCIL